MYIISVMIFPFSIKDFGHPKFLKSQFGHPVMKILAGLSKQMNTSLTKRSVIVNPLLLKEFL